MFRLLSLIFFVVVLALPLSAGAQEMPDAQASAPVIETGDGAPADGDIRRRIIEIFSEIEAIGPVTVDVTSGVVTLSGELGDAPSVARAEELANRVDGVVTVNNELTVSRAVNRQLTPALDRITNRLRDFAAALPLFAIAAAVFAMISGAGFWIAARRWPWTRIAPNEFIRDLIGQVIRLVFILLGAVLALDLIGATAVLGTILGAAGIAGLAIGFAVRDTVENYLASILLSIRQPFAPKELVRIGEHEGHVVRLTSRATILLSVDGNHIRIPNADVFSGTIVNYSRNPQRRFDFELGVNPDGDLAEAVRLGLEALNGLGFVLNDPSPDAWVARVGDSSVVIWYGAWVDQTQTDFCVARGEAIRVVKDALEGNEFSLPEPTYRIVTADQPETQTSPAPRRRKKRTPAAEVQAPKDADNGLDQLVDEARQNGDGDLLSTSAKSEI